MRRSSLRIMLAISFAMVTAIVAVQPAAAARILQDCTGDCADYELYDDQFSRKGANCLYEAGNPGNLDKITVRPPQMHGLATDPAYSKVEWRFKIRRDPPGGPNTFGVIFTSSWQSAQANDMYVANAGGGFSRRKWVAPENVSGFYQVVVELRWWQSGSPQGLVRAQYEWYKAKRPGVGSYTNNEYCLSQY